MAYSPNQKYPGATNPDPNYQDGIFRDNNPSTTNNGSPLRAIDRNELLARDEAIMNDAGFEYNGQPDTPQNSQLFQAYKASLGNGANLLSNHNFLIASPDDSQPPPDATPRNYPPGFQIFSGVFANETTGITNLTYVDGHVSFSGGDFYMAVANTGAIARLIAAQLTASVADFDGKPRTRGVSFALVGDEYRVTVGVDALEDAGGNATPLGSVKFEQGSVATGHEFQTKSKNITYNLNAISAFLRSQSDVNDERVSVESFGMVADNFLDDGVTINPNRTDNSAAFQAAINWCESTDVPTAFDKALYIPGNARGYWIPTTCHTSEELTQFTIATTRSLKIYGDGKSSILVGNGGAPATYVNGVNDGSDSILRIHRSNVIYENLQFRDTPVGLYMGQNPESSVRSSHTNMNRGKNIWWQNCGTCLLNQPGKTNYNNSLENYQMQGYQIGIHNGLPFHHNDPDQDTDLDVSNRNNYAFFSMNNGWCAVLFDNGDTNTFTSGTIESNNGSSAGIGAVGPAPSQIHDGIATAVYSDQTKHAYGVNTHKWVNIECEANTRDLYLDGSGWGFSNVFMDSTKVELGPNGIVPKWTSTDSPAVAGKFGNHHMGDLHIKTSIGVTDPFNPTAGITSQDRGLYIDGGRISDTDGRPTEYDVAANCPQISAITSGTTKHSTFGKIVSWQGHIEFDQPSANTLVITLPNTSQIDNDSNANLVFNLVASGVASDEFARGVFIQTNNVIQISAPPSGWAATGNELNINLTWRQV